MQTNTEFGTQRAGAMDSCWLTAFGRDFDVDRFLAGSGFVVGKVWHRGELTFKGSHQNSGFTVTIFEAPQSDEEALVGELQRFVSTHLARLQSLPIYSGSDVDVGLTVEREVKSIPKYNSFISKVFHPDSVNFLIEPELFQALGLIGAGLIVRVLPPEIDSTDPRVAPDPVA